MKAYLIDFENVKSKGLTGIEQLAQDDKVIIFYSENSDTISFEMHRKVMTSNADIEYLKVRVGGKNALDFQLSTLLGYLLAKELYTHIFIISGDKGFDKLHDFWNVSFADRNSVTVFRTQTLASAVAYADSRAERTAPAAEPEIQAVTLPEIVSQAEAETAEEQEPVKEQEAPAEAAPVMEEKAEPVLKEDVRITKTSRRRGRKPRSAAELIHNSLLGIVDISDKDAADILACAAESEDKEDFHNALAKIFKSHATDLYKVLRPKYLRIKEALGNEEPAENTAPAEETAVSAAAHEAERETEKANEPAEIPADTNMDTNTNTKRHLNDSELFDQFTRELAAAGMMADQRVETVRAEEEHAADDEADGQTEKAAEEPAVAEETQEPEKKPRRRTARRKTAKAKKSRLTKELEKLLGNDCTEEEIETVSRIFEETDTKQKLYLSIVKEYRKDRGCEIYKLIRADYNVLCAFRENAMQEA